MKIALYDSDKTNFPNLALMKLSAYHKVNGDEVVIYDPLMSSTFDKTYSSKVFTFTSDIDVIGKNIERGGTGYKIYNKLPDEIEHICPDYDLYNLDYSMGFLTRGCPRKCPWCVVPKKEGRIKAHADIEEFARHKKVILLDNNVLASEHGIKQIEKISKLGLKIDFNQGLDARLIDDHVAKLLSKVKWIRFIRLACDTKEQMPIIQKTVTKLRWHNANPAQIFVYCLVKDIDDALERVKFLKGLYLNVFAQPYIDFETNKMPSREQKNFARWVNHKAIFNSVEWSNYV